MRQNSLILTIIFLLINYPLISQNHALNYIILKGEITFEQITKNEQEFSLKSANQPIINVFHGRSGTKITVKNQTYTIENYNSSTSTFKNIGGEYIGLKLSIENYHLIGFNNNIFKVYTLKNNIYRIELAEPIQQVETTSQRNYLNIKSKGKTIQLITSLNQIPVEIIPAIILDKFRNNPIDLSYYQDKHSPLATKIALVGLSLLIGIVILINQ